MQFGTTSYTHCCGGLKNIFNHLYIDEAVVLFGTREQTDLSEKKSLFKFPIALPNVLGIILLGVAFLWQQSEVSSCKRDEIMTPEILIWYAGNAANFPIVSLGTAH